MLHSMLITEVQFIFVLQQKLSSDDDLELPRKRVKPSPKDQQAEDVECEPASCQGIKGECSLQTEKYVMIF